LDPTTPSNVWFWDGLQVTRVNYAATSYNLQDTVFGLLQNIPLTPVVGEPPTSAQVVDWIETNVANGVSVPNGTLLYFIGSGTEDAPDYIWQVADDATAFGGLVKQMKSPTLEPVLETRGDSIGIVGGNAVLQSVTPDINYGNVWFVSPTGDDATGEKGNPALPLQRLYTARDSAVTGDLIRVQPGTYSLGSTAGYEMPADSDYDLGKDGVNWFFEENSFINWNPPGHIPIFEADSGEVVRVRGALNLTGFNDYFGFICDSATLELEFDDITHYGYTFHALRDANLTIVGNNLTTIARPLIRMNGLKNNDIVIDIGTLNVTNASAGYPFGVLQFENLSSSLGGAVTDTVIMENSRISVDINNFTANTALIQLHGGSYQRWEGVSLAVNIGTALITDLSRFSAGLNQQVGLITYRRDDLGQSGGTPLSTGDKLYKNLDISVDVSTLRMTDGYLFGGQNAFGSGDEYNGLFQGSAISVNIASCYAPRLGYLRGLELDANSKYVLSGNYYLSSADTSLYVESGTDILMQGYYRGAGSFASVKDSSSLTLANTYAEFVSNPPVAVSNTASFSLKNTTLLPMMPAYATNDLVYTVTKATEEERIDSLIAIDSTMFLTLPAGTYKLDIEMQAAASTSRDFEAGLTADYPGNWRADGALLAQGWESFVTGLGQDGTTSGGGETPIFVGMKGTITLDSETTIYLQWGQQDDVATGFSKLYAGSFMKATKLN